MADGRISRPVIFCSRMCADQPAVRAQVNIDVNMCAGTSAKSSMIAAQNSTFVARTRSGRRAWSSSRAAVSRALDLLDHAEDAGGRTAVQRPGHGPDGAGEGGGDIRARRGDDAGGEGG